MQVHHVTNKSQAAQVDGILKNKQHVFVLVYMDGCGPCNATRPEWSKMCNALRANASLKANPNLSVLEINKDLLPEIRGIGQVDGFPTIRYFTNQGATAENYEDAALQRAKDRSADSFIAWIESKVGADARRAPSSAQNLYQRLRRAPTPGVVLRQRQRGRPRRLRGRRRTRVRKQSNKHKRTRRRRRHRQE